MPVLFADAGASHVPRGAAAIQMTCNAEAVEGNDKLLCGGLKGHLGKHKYEWDQTCDLHTLFEVGRSYKACHRPKGHAGMCEHVGHYNDEEYKIHFYGKKAQNMDAQFRLCSSCGHEAALHPVWERCAFTETRPSAVEVGFVTAQCPCHLFTEKEPAS